MSLIPLKGVRVPKAALFQRALCERCSAQAGEMHMVAVRLGAKKIIRPCSLLSKGKWK